MKKGKNNRGNPNVSEKTTMYINFCASECNVERYVPELRRMKTPSVGIIIG
jgi:hypothetical protein